MLSWNAMLECVLCDFATFGMSYKLREFWRSDYFIIGVMGMLQGKGISSLCRLC